MFMDRTFIGLKGLTMGKNLLGGALVALVGVAAVSAGAMAQGTGEDGARPTVRRAEPGSSGGVAPGDRGGSGVGSPSRVEPRAGAPVAPSLGDVNRGMSGYYRNRIGMTPPSGRLGGGGGRGSGGRW
jgi:hypothetical protein